ncbi:MAG: HAD superfamily hydrolase (TIGR01509 family) [Verrucomicrobiales bacterium]|jgi:HAD superfamily hydrolase (TIGR01509 family)
MATAIFDWDGIIIDSHDQHAESWTLLAEEQGSALPEDFFKKSFGMRNQSIFPMFFSSWVDADDKARIAELADRKEELYRELVRRDGIEPLGGVVVLLESLAEAGIPCSVGSSTPRANIDAIMEVIGLGDRFQAITAAEDVTEGKPDPQVFLMAAAKVGGTPQDSVVFEDAHVGIAAGLAAGMKVIAVATTHPIESLGDAHLAVESLDEVCAATLLDLLAR